MKRILLVDDDREYMLHMQNQMVQSGFEIVGIAFDGASAHAQALELVPDIIIMDIILPKMDGIAVLQALRERGLTKTRVFITTALNSPDILSLLSPLNISGFFIKPFDMGQLVQRIQAITGQVPVGGPLSLDKDATIQQAVALALKRLGVPLQVKGYRMLSEAIYHVIVNPEEIHSMMRQLYPAVASVCHSSPARVERNIRHIIEMIWDRCRVEVMEEYFGNSLDVNKDKPTNSEFIATIANHVRTQIY